MSTTEILQALPAPTGPRAEKAAVEESISVKRVLVRLVSCTLLAATVFALTAIALPLSFGSVDDVHMQMIVSGVGVCDHPDPHMLFQNILVGTALSQLYTHASEFPWYGAMLCLASICAFGQVLTVASMKPNSLARNLLWT
ncbi:MAG: hypothetical protein ACRD3W_29790, partial [Terriglobales bacterium]